MSEPQSEPRPRSPSDQPDPSALPASRDQSNTAEPPNQEGEKPAARLARQSLKSDEDDDDLPRGMRALPLFEPENEENEVHFVLSAEFDIDQGATLTHQYPFPTGAREQCVPLPLSSLLPSSPQAHRRADAPRRNAQPDRGLDRILYGTECLVLDRSDPRKSVIGSGLVCPSTVFCR